MFGEVMTALWNVMQIPITLYGFTVTMGQLYLFSLIGGLVCYAVFKILWG